MRHPLMGFMFLLIPCVLGWSHSAWGSPEKKIAPSTVRPYVRTPVPNATATPLPLPTRSAETPSSRTDDEGAFNTPYLSSPEFNKPYFKTLDSNPEDEPNE